MKSPDILMPIVPNSPISVDEKLTPRLVRERRSVAPIVIDYKQADAVVEQHPAQASIQSAPTPRQEGKPADTLPRLLGVGTRLAKVLSERAHLKDARLQFRYRADQRIRNHVFSAISESTLVSDDRD